MQLDRKYYIKGKRIGLTEFSYEDHTLNYESWLDKDMQKNYNHKPHWKNYQEYLEIFDNDNRKPRFLSTIIRLEDNKPIGKVNLSPEDRDPDIAICIFSEYRKQGYGLEGMKLAVDYIFKNLDLEYIDAGVYEHNIGCIDILKKVGFKEVKSKFIEEVDVFTGEEVKQLLFRLEK